MQFSKWVTLIFGALCLVAVAGVVNAPHLYYMAAILLTLPGISYALGWYALRGLSFTRELPSTAWEGEESKIVYAVQNRSAFSRYFLTVHEPFPDWIAPLSEEPPLFNVEANGTARVAHPVVFNKRGVYAVKAFNVTAMDPLGVFAFTMHVPCEGELVVYPMPQPIGNMRLSGAERYGWQEFTAVALRGSSVDPDGVRPYTPGDPLRRIHWRQTARTGQVSVIEFEESQSISLVVLLDLQNGTEVGQGTQSTLEYAVRMAASVTQLAIQQGASVRLVLPSDSIPGGEVQNPLLTVSGRGEEQLYLILDALARVGARSTLSVGDLARETVGHVQPGSTLMVLTSHTDRNLAQELAMHTATGANVTVVYIDPNSFAKGHRADRETNRFLSELMAVRANPYVLRANQTGYLELEAAGYANIQNV